MRLGLNLGYWGARSDPAEALTLSREAERLGYAVVWAGEAYGSDAVSVLAWLAGQTSRIDLGSAVMQIPARTPAMTAMTAATLDTLSGGRFRLGLGVSGPQVSEGWHGVRFDAALARTREYVDVVRLALSRAPLAYAGAHYPLPLPDGPGKALRLTVHPVREHLPVYLAALGPRSLELTGQIADGWLALFLAPERAKDSLAAIAAGRAASERAASGGVAAGQAARSTDTAGRPASAGPLDGFDVAATVPLSLDASVSAASDRVREHAALYLGGMGSRERNVYTEHAVRMGFEAGARQVQERYLAGDRAGAAAAVPAEFLDATCLLGPVERVADRICAYAEAGVTTLSVSVFAADADARCLAVRRAAEALELSGVGS